MVEAGYRDTFRGTAWYYSRYRRPYPREFLGSVVDRLGLDGTGRLLDLGCGTGRLTIPLSVYFEEVVALDPEPEMLEEARIQLREGAGSNIRWRLAGSAELDRLAPEVGSFRLATMGNAFHWMDRDETLRALDRMVVPGGGIAVIGDQQGSPPAWQQTIDTVIRRWLGETRRAGSGTYCPPVERHEEVLCRSSFSVVETFCYDLTQRWTVDEIVGQLYSTSF